MILGPKLLSSEFVDKSRGTAGWGRFFEMKKPNQV
jgi:hypothetical protein